VNIGLLAGASRAFYVNPQYRRDSVVISSTVAIAVTLLSAEGFAVEKYRQTPQGQAEEKRAKEGTLIYKHAGEQILRRCVLGGLVGAGQPLHTIVLRSRRLIFRLSQRHYPQRVWLLWLRPLESTYLG
jgi:hypothetical protein